MEGRKEGWKEGRKGGREGGKKEGEGTKTNSRFKIILFFNTQVNTGK